MGEARADIQVTVADLSADIDEGEAAQFLSSDELARAARLQFHEHRRRFLRAHIALRRILSSATGVPAASLRFVSDANGKPRLADSQALHFNLSHSGDFAAFATCAVAPVGIDCEALREIPNALALAKRFFTTEEQQQLESLGGEPLHRASLRIWTAKEALLKGVGLGLRVPLSAFSISLSGAHYVQLGRICEPAAALRGWHAEELQLSQPLLLCVASPLPGARGSITRFRWESLPA